MSAGKIMVVDDDSNICELCGCTLKRGFRGSARLQRGKKRLKCSTAKSPNSYF